MTPSSVRALAKIDPKLAKLIRRAGPITLEIDPKESPFVALTRSIVHQQLHGKAAASIHKRLLEIYSGKRHPTPEDILKTDEASLRQAGLSGSKTRALKDLAQKTLEGIVPTRREIEKLSDEEIITRLTEVRGVGPWTVEMLLIFSLGRPDVFPVTDYGVRNGFAMIHGLKELPAPKALLPHGEKWRPHRSTASLYLWRAVDLAKAK